LQHIPELNSLAGPANRIVEEVQRHLFESYHIEKDQGPPDLGWIMEHQIPGNRNISFSGQKHCPHCPVILTERRKVLVHFQNAHPDLPESSEWEELPVVKMAQMPFEGTEHLWYEIQGQHCPPEREVAALSLDDVQLPPIPFTPLPPPKFCQELGYISWIQSIGGPTIPGLLAIPGTPLTKILLGKDQLLEKTLFRIHTFLKEYLGSGERWLFAYHHRLREILRKGCGLTSPTLVTCSLFSH